MTDSADDAVIRGPDDLERNTRIGREFADAINARDWDGLDRVVAVELGQYQPPSVFRVTPDETASA